MMNNTESIIEIRRAEKLKLKTYGLKFKFDTSEVMELKSNNDKNLMRYIASVANEVFIKSGLYFNKVFLKKETNEIFIQTVRNDINFSMFDDEFQQNYAKEGYKVFYGFTLGMYVVYTDKYTDITEEIITLTNRMKDGELKAKKLFNR